MGNLGGLPRAQDKDRALKISIVTPCFNSARTLERTIRSVLDQGHPDIEYFLVDGGSKDSTLDIIRKYEGRVTRWISEKDSGVYDAMNKGLRMATGRWVGIINSDDAYAPGTFARVEAMAESGDADILYGDIRMMYAHRLPVVYPSDGALSSASFRRMPIQHPAAFVRREVYEADGIFDPAFRISGDFELMLRFHARGRRFRHSSEVWAEMDPGGLSDKRWMEGKKEIRKALELHGAFHPPLSLLFRADVARMKVSQVLEGVPVLRDLQKAYRNAKSRASGR